ncbi:MAG: hypothetical protein AAF589_08500 [Planctomycetota bacterium]
MTRPSVATVLIFAALLLPCAGASGQSPERFESMMKSWDKNGDGVLTKDEAPERAWRYLQRRAEAAGIGSTSELKISDMIAAGRDEEDEDEDRDRGRGKDSSKRSKDKPATPGFKVKPANTKVQGFDGKSSAKGADDDERRSSSSSNSSEYRGRAERYARGLMDRYDRDKNRILERSEWERMRGDPEKADANGDGVITFEELTGRLEYNYRTRADDDDDRRDDRTRERRRETSRSDRKERDSASSYRFLTAHERLPKGLPSWFVDRDKNGDGQVAMHEYSRTWSDSRAAEFARYDANGDGLLTPDEMVGKR